MKENKKKVEKPSQRDPNDHINKYSSFSFLYLVGFISLSQTILNEVLRVRRGLYRVFRDSKAREIALKLWIEYMTSYFYS